MCARAANVHAAQPSPKPVHHRVAPRQTACASGCTIPPRCALLHRSRRRRLCPISTRSCAATRRRKTHMSHNCVKSLPTLLLPAASHKGDEDKNNERGNTYQLVVTCDGLAKRCLIHLRRGARSARCIERLGSSIMRTYARNVLLSMLSHLNAPRNTQHQL